MAQNSDGDGVASDSGTVKSAHRALLIIEFVGARRSVTFTDLLMGLSLPRSSAHGLLQTLLSRGWLEYDSSKHEYSLGLRAWEIGHQYARHRELTQVAKPVMDSLAHELGETVQLARLDGIDNVYLSISESPHPLRFASTVGLRLPSHATGIGKAMLSQLPAAKVAERFEGRGLMRFTEHTLIDIGQLLSAVDEARSCGYAIDDEEYQMGCRCVAVPLTVLGDPPAIPVALSITAPIFRCGTHWPQRQLDALLGAAHRINTLWPLSADTPAEWVRRS